MTKITCPGCGLELESENPFLDDQYTASSACRQLYDELASFTLSLGYGDFIHQLAVDTYAAQHSGPGTKPIRTVFSLIGLYLTFERGYTGRQVQQAHMILGKKRRQWPLLNPPGEKTWLTVQDIVPGLTKENYRERLNSWGKSVWGAWNPRHEHVAQVVEMYLDV